MTLLQPQLTDIDLALAAADFREFRRYVHVKHDDGSNRTAPIVPWPFQDHVIDVIDRPDRPNVIWLKERQIGATKTVLAPRLYHRAAFTSGASVGVVSAKEVAVKSFMRQVSLIHENLPPALRRIVPSPEIGVTSASFGSRSDRSNLIAYTSAPNSGVGETPDIFLMDEAAEHPYAQENFETVFPGISNAQIIITSTSNPRVGPSGFFYEMYQRALNGESNFVPIFTGRYSRPDRADSYYEEKLLELGQRVFDAYYPLSPEMAFQAQEGLVYADDFDSFRNVAAMRFTPADCEHLYVGYDLGGGDPTAMLLLGVRRDPARGRDHLHVFAEYFRPTGLVSTEDLAQVIAGWERRFDIPPSLSRNLHIVPDHNDLNFAHTWRRTDKRVWYPESRARMTWLRDKSKGLSTVARFLRESALTIDPSCTNLIRQFGQYHWVESSDHRSHDRYLTGTPSNHHADCLDALRYSVSAAFRDLFKSASVTTVARGLFRN